MTISTTRTTAPELAFTLAAGQNRFFLELTEALVDELRTAGVPASIHCDGAFPVPSKGRVHVLIPPHEYVALTGYDLSPDVLRRTILISAEQPESSFFQSNLALARHAGAVFDINPRAVRAYVEADIPAAHLQLGYTRMWDVAAHDRDIDVIFLGRLTPRRAKALASYADIFEALRCRIILSDNSVPNLATSSSFVAGADKRALLSRSRIMLNIHGEDEPYFEWLRVIEGICAGCVIVSENSTDIAPLEWGHHLITGRLDSLGLLCKSLLRDDHQRESMAASALDLLRSHPLSNSVSALAKAAIRVDAAAVRPSLEFEARLHAAQGQRQHAYDIFGRRHPPPRAGISDGEAVTLRTLKHQQLALNGVRRRLERIELALSTSEHEHPDVVTIAESSAWRTDRACKLTVITPLYNHRDEIVNALNSLECSLCQDWEAVIVDDGSSDGGAEIVERWIRDHPFRACCLVRHSSNRGLAAARNTGVSHSRTGLLLMLDADNELRRVAMDRLIRALDDDPDASFSWGIMEQFTADGPVGLLSAHGWDPERLRSGNYIDAFALIRKDALEALGGYSYDSRLYGWEDYDLWVRMAETGRHGAFVPEIIARYRVGASSMISHTNVSVVDAFAAVADHAPSLMAGLRLPL